MKTLVFSLSLVVEHNHHNDQQHDHYGACYQWFKHGRRRVGHPFSLSPVTELKLSSFVIVDSIFIIVNQLFFLSGSSMVGAGLAGAGVGGLAGAGAGGLASSFGSRWSR